MKYSFKDCILFRWLFPIFKWCCCSDSGHKIIIDFIITLDHLTPSKQIQLRVVENVMLGGNFFLLWNHTHMLIGK